MQGPGAAGERRRRLPHNRSFRSDQTLRLRAGGFSDIRPDQTDVAIPTAFRELLDATAMPALTFSTVIAVGRVGKNPPSPDRSLTAGPRIVF